VLQDGKSYSESEMADQQSGKQACQMPSLVTLVRRGYTMTLGRDVGGGTRETLTGCYRVCVPLKRQETCPEDELGNDLIAYALRHDL